MNIFSGGGMLPPKFNFIDILRGFLGGTISIGGLSLLTKISTHSWLMAPFGATCVLLFAVSASPLAQPRNVIGGHLISTLIGLAFFYFFGDDPWVIATAVGTSIAAMQFFRIVHPPAGADPIVIIAAGTYGLDFMIFPVLFGSIFLVAVAAMINNVSPVNKWPTYWLGQSKQEQ